MFGTLVRLQGFVRRGAPAGVALVAVLVITACGSSKPAVQRNPSPNARALLRQTFTAQHRIRSGVLTVTLALTPTNPTGGGQPISVTVEGPFQSQNNRRLPAVDFNVSISAQNRTRSLSLTSTGGARFLTIAGESYELPASSLQMLESITMANGSTTTAKGSTTTAQGSTTPAKGSTTSIGRSKIRIGAADWAVAPRVVGSDRIGGVATTRIHAEVNADRLIADLSTLLPGASSLGVSSLIGQLPKQIPAPTQRRIAAGMRDPYADIWTGSSDQILRKLILSFETPAAAQLVGRAGGGARVVTLTLQYSDLNRPQSIVAPTSAHPYPALKAKLAALAEQLQGGTTPTTDTIPHKARAKPHGPAELTLSPYARCISNAEGNNAKMQKCATLSNGTSTRPH